VVGDVEVAEGTERCGLGNGRWEVAVDERLPDLVVAAVGAEGLACLRDAGEVEGLKVREDVLEEFGGQG